MCRKVVQDVKDTLAACGAEFKGPGKFPIPRVCVGMDHCNLGIIDTETCPKKILDKFARREKTRPNSNTLLPVALLAAQV